MSIHTTSLDLLTWQILVSLHSFKYLTLVVVFWYIHVIESSSDLFACLYKAVSAGKVDIMQ